MTQDASGVKPRPVTCYLVDTAGSERITVYSVLLVVVFNKMSLCESLCLPWDLRLSFFQHYSSVQPVLKPLHSKSSMMYVYLSVCLTVCLSVCLSQPYCTFRTETSNWIIQLPVHVFMLICEVFSLYFFLSLSLCLSVSVCLSVSLSLCLSVLTISFTVSVVILLLRSVSCPTIFLCLFLPPLCRRRLYFSVFCWLSVYLCVVLSLWPCLCIVLSVVCLSRLCWPPFLLSGVGCTSLSFYWAVCLIVKARVCNSQPWT